VSLELRNASAGAVFVLLRGRGAAANAAGALDDAIAYDRSTTDSLAEEERFEPSVPVSGTTVFETARFGPSGASPCAREIASFLTSRTQMLQALRLLGSRRSR
jgi:hypothetical protein